MGGDGVGTLSACVGETVVGCNLGKGEWIGCGLDMRTHGRKEYKGVGDMFSILPPVKASDGFIESQISGLKALELAFSHGSLYMHCLPCSSLRTKTFGLKIG